MYEILSKKVEMIDRASKKNWFTDLNLDEKENIEIGLKQAENGEFISHETVMNQFAKWH